MSRESSRSPASPHKSNSVSSVLPKAVWGGRTETRSRKSDRAQIPYFVVNLSETLPKLFKKVLTGWRWVPKNGVCQCIERTGKSTKFVIKFSGEDCSRKREMMRHACEFPFEISTPLTVQVSLKPETANFRVLIHVTNKFT